MKLFSYFMAAIALAVVFSGAASAQNMSGTVVTKEIKFTKGKSGTTVSGAAKYGMSYVYTLTAKKGQTMDLDLAGKNSQLTFSLMEPSDETVENAFGVTTWSGELPKSGKYSIVVVMNDEKAGSVPFTLSVKIK